MRLIAKQEIKNGGFFVTLAVTDLTNDEKERILKFGSPQISIEPEQVLFRYKFVTSLPLHEINHTFSFTTQIEATSFLNVMRGRITQAVQILKSRQDDFSKQEEYEL